MTHAPNDKDSLFKLALLRSAFDRNLDVKFIEKILQMKGDINYKADSGEYCAGCTALHFANLEKLEVLQLLIKYGADFTIKNEKGQTILHDYFNRYQWNAKKYSNDWGLPEKLSDEVVAAILSAHVAKSISENPKNKDGLSHFHMACMADHAAAVQFFLNNGVPIDLAVDENSNVFPGCTPLQIAVKSCALEVVEVLIKCGADPCAKDKGGMTVVHWLIDNSIKIADSLIIVEILVDREKWLSKLKLNQKIIGMLLNRNKINSCISSDGMGFSDVHIACTIGDASVVEELLDQVTQIDHQVNADSPLWPGYTALHFAAHFDLDTVKLLLSKGANILIENTSGTTPFDICLERYTIEDIHYIMSTQPSWGSIMLLDGKTKLLDMVLAMQDINQFRSFLDNHIDNINTSVVKNSPLWPGFTLLHLAVILSEQPKNKSNYISTTRVSSGKTATVEIFDPKLVLIEECLNRGANVTAADVFGCTPLHLAFHHEQSHTMQKLLQFHHILINPIDKHNVAHLHIACASGDEVVVKRLLQSGADPNLRVRSHFKFYRKESPQMNEGMKVRPIPSGSTSLHASCVRSHFKFYRKETPQMNEGMKVRPIPSGSTSLHIAVAGGKPAVVKVLLDNGADANAIDERGATPIHCLLVQRTRDTEDQMADILFNADVKQVVMSDTGISHLHVASYFCNVEAVERLLDLGAEVDAHLGCQPVLNNFRDCYHTGHGTAGYNRYAEVSPLQVAVWNGSVDVVKLLIKRGADVLKINSHGVSPLKSLINTEDYVWYVTVLAELLSENEALARRVEEEYGLTLLHLACCDADLVAVKKLIDAGANVNAQINTTPLSQGGFTPLHMLYSEYFTLFFRFDNGKPSIDHWQILETTRMLLDAGADVNLCDARGNSPLHMITNDSYYQEETHGELMSMLLNRIGDFRVNPVDEAGLSHFHLACLQNNTMAIEKFLQHGADVNASLKMGAAFDSIRYLRSGSSALHLIARHALPNVAPMKVEAIDVLLNHGADIHAQDVDGNTVLHTIARFAPQCLDIFHRLLRAGSDLNKLNILCETPLATLLHSKAATPQVIELFIEHGSSVNDFNIADQKGFLARPLCVSDSTVDDRTRIFETLFKSRDIAKLDTAGRTAIHNIVSADGFDVSKGVSIEEYTRLIARLCNMVCDIDSQDQSGKTALHIAAQFKNNKAIVALLRNGADVNIVDSSGCTAFTYSLDICKCKPFEKGHQHGDVIATLYIQVRKLDYLELNVNEENINMSSKVKLPPNFRIEQLMVFEDELDKLRDHKFGKDSTFFNIIDILSETGVVAVYPLKESVRLVMNEFFRDINLYIVGNSEVFGLLQLQLRKSMKRITLIGKATKSLKQSIGFSFPDTCCERVLRCLSNFDLENLIYASNTLE